MRTEREPSLVIDYFDALEGFQGWLVIDTLDHSLCAGGMRVQPGLTREHLARMARNMTCKMRICGLRVDGAKSGIDYDPASPGKHAAMARFMAAVRPYIEHRYSMGPDLNVEMTELDAIGRNMGLPSVKMAVASAQGWDMSYFGERYQVLGRQVEGWPLGRIRVGYGVAVASLAVLDYLGIPCNEASVAIQGFGALAKAAAYGLSRKGVRISAFADQEKCIVAGSGKGLDVKKLLAIEGPLLPEQGYDDDVRVTAREEILRVPCDILVPAAVENTITEQVAGQLPVKAVVPGANLAVTAEADRLLHRKNIPVLPDLLSGSGGSLSMEGLFAPKDHPDPAEVLAHVEKRMTQLVNQILARSVAEGISPTQAALCTCAEAVPRPGTRPYGNPN